MLKLNDGKTGLIVIGSRQQKSKNDIPHINVTSITDIVLISTVLRCDVMLDSGITLRFMSVQSTGQLTFRPTLGHSIYVTKYDRLETKKRGSIRLCWV